MNITINVVVNGEERMIPAQAGENLLQVLQRGGVMIAAPCGGVGHCGKCRVVVDKPEDFPPNDQELAVLPADLLDAGARLACTRLCEGDLSVRVLASMTDALIQTDSWEQPYEPEPDIAVLPVQVPAATLSDQQDDSRRLLAALPGTDGISLHALRQLPDAMAGGSAFITVRDGRVLHAAARNLPPWGVAVDIGTTTMVAYLMELPTGRQLGVASCLNPQKAHGDDVITRTDFTIHEADGLARLQGLAVDAINAMVVRLCHDAGASPDRVYDMTLVGNTVMMHILAGVSPRNIAVAPFIPAFTQNLVVPGAALGLAMHPEGQARILPCVAGYVGADIVGGVLATGLMDARRPSLMIDIGTNGEMVLGSREGMLACSVAAGPAFEGAHIRFGMGGVAGAVSAVEMKPDAIRVRTIGGQPAQGMCGSAIVDVTAGLLEQGILDDTGRLEPGANPWWDGRIVDEDQGYAVEIVTRAEGAAQDVLFCQRDVREVQLAKAAVAAGIDVLIHQMGIKESDIDAVYLAGGFGSYINPVHACRMGLLPKDLLPVIRAVGNAAGAGARRALLSRGQWAQCDRIREGIRYIELSSRPDFQNLFVDHMMFEP